MSPAFPFSAPASAPVTPAYSRSHSSSMPVAPATNPPPLTPQRIPRSHRHTDTLQSLFRSPFTPESTLSTPYTPFSLRSSLDSWQDDSAITTPDSPKSSANLHYASPLALRTRNSNIKRALASAGPSPAAAGDWRSRASQHGIRVDHRRHEAAFDDGDENYPSTDVRPLFVRRPVLPATPARRTLAALNTPPPRAADAERIKVKGAYTDPACARRRPTFPQSDLFDIDENDYAPYPTTFGADPFDGSRSFTSFDDHVRTLSALSDSPPPASHLPHQHLHHDGTVHMQQPRGGDVGQAFDSGTAGGCCPVCGNRASTLVALAPCAHVLCSACFTSSLNIVGEKNMECAVCRCAVDNFEMRTAPAEAKVERVQVLAQRRREEEGTVLRVDNVPWDVTPAMMKAWLKQPVRRVHILLDRKGKTQSHAFVEMRDADGARAALRGAQNSVLGRGKRARGVTVTRSSQEELMRALFPMWRGGFEGIRPSLHGLSDTEQIAALSAGLLDETELKALLHLVRSPDSHFLKVPSLPFHALISILEKFPAEDGGRQLWTPTLRDVLFDVTLSAIKILAADDAMRGEDALLADFLRTAIRCTAFTQAQRAALTGLINPEHSPSLSISAISDEYAGSGVSAASSGMGEYGMGAMGEYGMNAMATDLSGPFDFQPAAYAPVQLHGQLQQKPQQFRFDALAREFRCDPGLVEALAARLTAGELM